MGIRLNRLAEAVLTSTNSFEPPRRGGSNEYQNLCVEQKYEKYQNFLSENFQFGGKIFSIFEYACFRSGKQDTRGRFSAILQGRPYLRFLVSFPALQVPSEK